MIVGMKYGNKIKKMALKYEAAVRGKQRVLDLF